MDLLAFIMALKAQGMTAAQITEAVNEYLQNHPDALDQAAVEAIVGEALTSQDAKLDNIENAVADLEAGSLSAFGASAGQVPTADGAGSWAWADKVITHQVSGSNPVIVALAGHRYICGEVATITINPPANGCIDVIFESGSTAAALTATGVQWPAWFDATALEANATYEINILDGYGAVGVWTA